MALQSFFSLLFTALQSRLQAEVPEIRWIDQDLGQLEHYEIRPGVSWPCVLIDFNSTSYDNESQNAQIGNVNILIRLGFPPFTSSNNLVPAATKENALQFWELEMKLYQALQGWAPDGDICQPLTRVSAATEQREDAYRIRQLIFTTAFFDESAMAKYIQAPRPRLAFNFD